MEFLKSSVFMMGIGGALLLSGCGGEEAGGVTEEGETITLRAATGLSAQHAWWEGAMVPWMERVEELTEGQVEFETFTGGELVAVPDEGSAVLDGTIDVALILPIYQPDQFPMAEVTMLPLSYSDTEIASNAWRQLIESEEELGNGQTYFDMQFADFRVFPISTTQEYSISTTGKEFNTVDDVVGTSLRTPSRIHEVYAEETGIDSVTMPAVEMYDALSRGAFDGSFYSIADWSGYGFQDLFTYTLTGVNFGHFNAFIGMDEERWAELPEDVQEAMVQAHDDIFGESIDIWTQRAEEVIAENEAAGGKFADFADLDPAVQEHFNEGIVETWINYAEMLEADGLPGYELVRKWRELIIEEGGEVPEAVMDL
ncbi:type 2 periplasmic-binding domain-containing protein [Planococcus lenghuensis]|uniref:TRAP transporter n=1 Tax=Planococcus lenghuensis TaxID=2213202 RepID=A0A1Q2L2Q7_9BACL|nr:TRAP transporter [Planococcus lenghuensis]AQQ54721.1 TRAP transporter [Planococcus lenghuensis]